MSSILSQQRDTSNRDRICYLISGVITVIVPDHGVQEPLAVACGKSLERFGDASCSSSSGKPYTILDGKH